MTGMPVQSIHRGADLGWQLVERWRPRRRSVAGWARMSVNPGAFCVSRGHHGPPILAIVQSGTGRRKVKEEHVCAPIDLTTRDEPVAQFERCVAHQRGG